MLINKVQERIIQVFFLFIDFIIDFLLISLIESMRPFHIQANLVLMLIILSRLLGWILLILRLMMVMDVTIARWGMPFHEGCKIRWCLLLLVLISLWGLILHSVLQESLEKVVCLISESGLVKHWVWFSWLIVWWFWAVYLNLLMSLTVWLLNLLISLTV